jgi:hypothetical protein
MAALPSRRQRSGRLPRRQIDPIERRSSRGSNSEAVTGASTRLGFDP